MAFLTWGEQRRINGRCYNYDWSNCYTPRSWLKRQI